MDKKYIIGTVVVVLAVAIGFFWGQKSAVAPGQGEEVIDTSATEEAPLPVVAPTKKPVTSTPTAPKGSTYPIAKDGSFVISYTGAGFTPSIITVSVGKSVKFVNNSDTQMSIASADVGGMGFTSLNQGSSVGRGGTFYATLEIGTWHYMNRLNQAQRGTIVVK